jgi:hypothetical protein
VLDGLVEEEVAANAATNRHDFEIAVQQAIKRRRAEEKAAAQAAEEEAAEEAAQGEEADPLGNGNGSGLRVVAES